MALRRKPGGKSDAGELAAAGTNGRTRRPMTRARAKRLIGVGTTVAPLLAPYVLSAATAVRGSWDSYRAGRLGIPPEQLGQYRGPGGTLHARLSHVAEALTALESSGEANATSAAHAFAVATRPRIADLAVAVRAAEQMPATRRRTAFKAIGRELDGIEETLLSHLGVNA